MIIESDKRKESEIKGRLIPVDPTGEQKVWPGGFFSVNCYPQAFNPKSTCKLVLCHVCNDGQGGKADTNTHGNKRRRNRGNDVARKSKVISTGGERKGICPNHIKKDLLNLQQETNKEYLKDDREKKGGEEKR